MAHAHEGACDHSHEFVGGKSPASKLAAGVTLTLAFVAIEAIAGVFAHSLALLSDAGHNFADAAALGFSWYAVWIARRPANAAMTFGYHRVAILAAPINAVSLVVIAILIGYEAAHRLAHPEAVHGWLMVLVAVAAIIVNATIGVWLHSSAKDNINVRSAYVHMLGDAVSAFGVVIAGLLVICTGWHIADPVVSFLIAALILFSSWGILKESVGILLEGTPAGLDVPACISAINNVPGVRGSHDLHVWTVGPGAIACSVHILVEEQTVREAEKILRAVVERLDRDFRINHATVQVEVEAHESNEIFCSMEVNADVGHKH
jgi:cobalt-zinc-cadmium efflux system protein